MVGMFLTWWKERLFFKGWISGGFTDNVVLFLFQKLGVLVFLVKC